MKQIVKTPEIVARLQRSIGAGVDVNTLAVFEATALNTLPLRKNHPLYRGAIAERGLLLEMASALEAESRPVYLMHNSDAPTPVGRIFYGEVRDRGSQSELRALFFVDSTEAGIVAKLDSGVVDQVSVSILPKHIYSSKSGFDFLGPDATFEHVFTGTDPDGNVLGENGNYARMVGLDQFFELSLVGMGGAQNARIIPREESVFGSSLQKLAASGLDPNLLVLVASSEKVKSMDLTQLVEQLTAKAVELNTANTNNTALTAQVATLTAQVATLTAQVAAAGEAVTTIAARDASIVTLTANETAALAALKLVCTKVLTAAGKVTTPVPATIAEMTALIETTSTELTAALAKKGTSLDAVSDVKTAPAAGPLGAFRRPANR